MRLLGRCLIVMLIPLAALAQEKSVRPGINDSFKDPDVKKYIGTFEGESREIFTDRAKIIAACQLKPGMVVADIGAGTGLFTRLFAQEVGPKGKVFAVDIAQKFLDHIATTCKEAKLDNVQPILCTDRSTELPVNSVDVAFICDTYHHFEFPSRTMQSLHRALKPGGKVVLIDFQREPGKSREWVLNHVRAGKEVFIKEIIAEGFKLVREESFLKENYLVVLEKVIPAVNPMTPTIPGYGKVVPLPNASDPPIKGMKVVFDITAEPKEAGKPVPGLERIAALINLAGLHDVKPNDLQITVVLHGAATRAALDDSAYRKLTGTPNPNAELIQKLHAAGVELKVCGQALARQQLADQPLRSDVTIAVSAMTVLIRRQADGYAYIPGP